MRFPYGIKANGINLMLAHANGIPIIVTANATAVTKCSTAIHQPNNTSHTILANNEGLPACGSSTTSRPKGHSACRPIRKEAIPQGIVMINKQATTPAKA